MCLKSPQTCILVSRWGEWPPWTPLLMRAYAANSAIRWILIGDHSPSSIAHLTLPQNVCFASWPLGRLIERLRQSIGLRVRSLRQNNHSTSKISDLKPMFAEAFPELVDGCGEPCRHASDSCLLANLAAA